MDRSKKTGKKHSIIIVAVAVLLMAAICCAVLVYAELDRVSSPDDAAVEAAEMDGEDGAAAAVPAADVTYNSQVAKVKGITNIMLIGQDRRPGEDRARSDSMILCSMNESTGQIVMVSLMRDMYIPIPGYGNNRINASYAFGGMPLLDQTVEDNFGIHLDGNVEVDFEGFMSLIDKIGGVEIELSAEEAEYLNSNNTGLVNGVTTERWNLTPGVNVLNAQEALAYARTRFIGNSDWERTDRQRTVIASMTAKLKSLDPISQASFIHSALSCITTDLTIPQMLSYAFTVVSSGMKLADESFRLPVEGTYSSESIDGMSVLVPDTAANAAYLKQFIGAA
ncbi:MAG: LCP family protein [Blautia sp.]|nr:LCP family protein [Blautia sp.]